MCNCNDLVYACSVIATCCLVVNSEDACLSGAGFVSLILVFTVSMVPELLELEE
jgi:hypothetical protein